MSHRYLYRPPARNHPFLLSRLTAGPVVGAIPEHVDLRGYLQPPRDQGAEGCCSGFSTAALREALHNLAASAAPLATPNPPGPYLSPAYLYARTRMIEGSFPQDSGATVADEVSTLENYGAPPEAILPYSGDPSEAPTPAADVAAAAERLVGARCLNAGGGVSVSDVEEALTLNGPVVFGMPVYSSFESTGSDGLVPIPNTQGEQLLGGHAMLAVGFWHTPARLLVRNSWGTGWGLSGYCLLPYSMVLSWFEAWTASPQA